MCATSERLKMLTKERGMTQKELAQKANVTESAISYYFKGSRTPSAEILGRLATALGTTTDFLLGKSDDVREEDHDRLSYIQRNLRKLDPEKLKKAENILKAAFDDLFEDED